MKRFWIVGLTVAMIALAAWWVPLEVGSAGDGCSGGRTCAAKPPVPKDSGGPNWFYGGGGVDRIRRDDDRPATREGPSGEDEMHCDPGGDRAPTGAGEEFARSCEDVGARFF
jgi:hypothetical protein